MQYAIENGGGGMYRSCLIDPTKFNTLVRIGALREEGAVIDGAHTGRYPTPNAMGGGKPPGGLNVHIRNDVWGSAGITFTGPKDIDGFRHELGAGNNEQLNGKRVSAHYWGKRLVALSACEQ